jgi:hypothetical protein
MRAYDFKGMLVAAAHDSNGMLNATAHVNGTRSKKTTRTHARTHSRALTRSVVALDCLHACAVSSTQNICSACFTHVVASSAPLPSSSHHHHCHRHHNNNFHHHFHHRHHNYFHHHNHHHHAALNLYTTPRLSACMALSRLERRSTQGSVYLDTAGQANGDGAIEEEEDEDDRIADLPKRRRGARCVSLSDKRLPVGVSLEFLTFASWRIP